MKVYSNKYFSIILAIMLALFLVACNDDDLFEQRKDIVETAEGDPDLETLVTALEATGLDNVLKGDGPFTVFAPTDAAFQALEDADPGILDFLLANPSVLTGILKFHVIGAEVFADEAIALDGTSAETLAEVPLKFGEFKNLRIDVVDGDLFLSLKTSSNDFTQAKVTVTNITASNGVIHKIDAVLDPDDAVVNIVETAVNAGGFNILAAALVATGLDQVVATDSGPLTVFAPTDEAFEALGIDEAYINSLDQDGLDELALILLYHVFGGSVLSAQAIAADGSSIKMLNDGFVSIDIAASDLVLNLRGTRPATVGPVDILCSNGVIHVIDNVLNPADSTSP